MNQLYVIVDKSFSTPSYWSGNFTSPWTEKKEYAISFLLAELSERIDLYEMRKDFHDRDIAIEPYNLD